MDNIESIEKLRMMIESRNNPIKELPGVYCWWFKKDSASEFLKSLLPKLEENKLKSCEINGEVYWALYFGMSNDLKQRIKWHLCQHHTISSVKSGFLSTLRQTLSALLRINMSDSEREINDFMDKNCYWEWNYTSTKSAAEDFEKRELQQTEYYYPLNIRHNRMMRVEWLKELIEERRKYNK